MLGPERILVVVKLQYFAAVDHETTPTKQVGGRDTKQNLRTILSAGPIIVGMEAGMKTAMSNEKAMLPATKKHRAKPGASMP